MARRMMLVVPILLLLLTTVVKSEGTCDEYGVGDVSECGTGFASLYHIDVTEGNVDLRDRDGRQVVYPNVSFACNGTIRKWIIGAKWRGNSGAYTELQIWRRSSGSVYTKVGNTTIMVGTRNDSQLYEYPLETPLAFQEGDILGYFQPDKDDSELDLYLEDSKRLSEYRNDVDDLEPPTGPFDISTATSDDHYPLIGVVTDPTDCGCGFMSLERMNRLLGDQISTSKKTYEEKQLLMPDIQFTCSGEVVKWIMGGKWSDDEEREYYPELQIWRPSGGTTYQRVHSTTILAAMERDDDVYEFIPDSPIPFQPGDILGVFQPPKDESRLRVNYDDRGSSVYYYIETDDDDVVSPHTTFDISHEDVETQTALPLVTVEIVMYVTSSAVPQATSSAIIHATTTTTSSATISATTTTTSSVMLPARTSIKPTETSTHSSSPSPSTSEQSQPDNDITAIPSQPMQPSSFIATYTTTTNPGVPPPTLLPSLSPSQTDTDRTQEPSEISNKSSFDGGAIAGIVLSLLVVLLLVAIVTVIIIVFMAQRRKYYMNIKDNGLANPIYDKALKMVKFSKEASVEGVEILEPPATTDNYYMYQDTMELYAIPDAPAHYEVPQQQEASGEWGIYVPTKDQRNLYQEVDDIYSYAGLKPVVRDSSGVGGEEKSFFTESEVYWVPASNPAELYEQLSKYRFREIQRHQIRIVKHLGSGHFGTVNKGFWQCPKGEVEVAIKLLQPGASEDDRVKFLQEAAIMGQFSHPNVVSLHGVVTLGEPVMIVMELMENGDLKDYLTNLRPTPGEMVSETLCQQLLDLCHQVCAGMRYLSDKAFVHRDIAARNILVSGKVCKIADFGMARNLEESDYYTSHGGQVPVKWTAPEALHYKKYSTASDVWSFGCLMYEIWSLGHKPFEGYSNMETVKKVISGWRLPPPPGCPKEIYHLMVRCWHPDASSRPQFAQLLQVLSRPEHELLSIPEEEGRVHPQATLLGAPLEAGRQLYLELQNTYIKK